MPLPPGVDARGVLDAAIATGEVSPQHRRYWEASFKRDPQGTAATLYAKHSANLTFATAARDAGVRTKLLGRTVPTRRRTSVPAPVPPRSLLQSPSGAEKYQARPPDPNRPKEPKLFGDGDLPAFTASGIAPEELRKVPWQARPALARAKTREEAYELLQKYSGPDGELSASVDAAAGGPLHRDVVAWEEAQATYGRAVIQYDLAKRGQISQAECDRLRQWADDNDIGRGRASAAY